MSRVPKEDTEALATTIRVFQEKLPDWWFSFGSCSTSRHATCGPDKDGADADLLDNESFAGDFHHEGKEQDSTIASSLMKVMYQAVTARQIVRGTP